MSNSYLVNHTRLSPNNSGARTHKIDTVSVHCVVGQCSVETLGSLFSQSSRQASSNYGIGYDGRVGLYVDEGKRSWCTSSNSNDQRAVTIEVASDAYHPYKVRDAAYKTLIELLADICRRNKGLGGGLRWQGNKALIGQTDKQNMTVHRWFANKACPGDYLYNLHGQIASEVNALLAKNYAYLNCEGDYVKHWQELLIAKGYSCGAAGADGDFGSGTLAAVKKFQTDNGLTADGVIGDDTIKALTGADEPDEPEAPDTPDEPEKPETEAKIVKLKGADVFSAPPVLTGVTGAFTIVEESGGYGKLKSGAGWVKLPAE